MKGCALFSAALELLLLSMLLVVYLFASGLIVALVYPSLFLENASRPKDAPPLPHGDGVGDAALGDGSSRMRALRICLLFSTGILHNHVLVLLFRELRLALGAGVLLSAFYLGAFLFRFRKNARALIPFRACSSAMLPVFSTVLFAYVLSLVNTPIAAHDARSIWFFHAKMIYYSGGLFEGSGWGEQAYFFSHPDYPKLVSSLAAQIAYAVGLWNEYLPKLSLLIVFLAPLLSISAYVSRAYSFVFLLLLLVLARWDLLSNGYMDGFLSLYLALSVLFFAEWAAGKERVFFFLGISYVGIACVTKHEAQLAATAIFGVLLAFRFKETIAALWGKRPDDTLSPLFYLLFAMTGLVLWTGLRTRWGLESDLRLEWAFLERAQARTAEAGLVLRRQFVEGGLQRGVLVLGMTIGVAGINWRHLRRSRSAATPLDVLLFPVIASLIYAGGIFAIYMGSHWQSLSSHLDASVDRTMLAAVSMMSMTSFILLRRVEQSIR